MKRLFRRRTVSNFSRHLVLLVLAFLMLGQSAANAQSSLSPAFLDALELGTVWLKPPSQSGVCQGPVASGTPEQNGQSIFSFLTADNYLSPEQAAAVLGNMKVESGWQPQRLQGTPSGKITTSDEYIARFLDTTSPDYDRAYIAEHGIPGWGIVQWTSGAKIIYPEGQSKGKVGTPDDLGTQLTFLKDQLDGRTLYPETIAGRELLSTGQYSDGVLEEAVVAFQGNSSGAASPKGNHYTGFERPADQTGSVPIRTQYAREALTMFGSGGSTVSRPGQDLTCVGAGEQQVVGGFAFPVDLKYYQTNPEWFTKPHHDYPAADIPVETGTPVRAVAGGKIIKAPITTDDTSYGNGVWIDVGNGIEMIYGHGIDGGSIPGAEEGKVVSAGQLIMHSGDTGNVTGPHLHFEIRINGSKFCPQNLLVAIAEHRTIPELVTLPKAGCTYRGDLER